MGRRGKTLSLGACFAAGVLAAGLLAVGGMAADTTTSDTTTSDTTTAAVDTTQEATTVTVATTTTVERTTTQVTTPATTPAETTTAAESSDDGTPLWVWVLLAILAVGLASAIVLLARRGGHSPLSPEERGRRLDNAVATWATQGWALESQTLDSAVLQRAGERMIVAVDASGQITTRPG